MCLIQSELYNHILYERIKDYYIKHGDLTKETMNKIDWQSQDKAMSKLTYQCQHWVTKFVTNTCAVGITMKKWHKRDSDACPHCGSLHEDNTHVIKCTEAVLTQVWDTNIMNLMQYMINKNACSTVLYAIIYHLEAWRHDSTPPDTSNYPPPLLAVVDKQTEIGWRNFLFGQLSKKWKDVFVDMYDNFKSKQLTPPLLIQQLYHICFQIWDKRNQILHDQSEIHWLQQDYDLDPRITEQFNKGTEDLLPNDYHLVNATLSKLLDSNIDTKKEWLKTISAARRCTLKQDRATKSRQIMRRFLEGRSQIKKRNKVHNKNDNEHGYLGKVTTPIGEISQNQGQQICYTGNI